ncbi:MAG: hypothetical protein JXR43_00550 [Burkholderiaceae bacterium]|nr:hypothetical protein [Burkholderiaceae bacterium]
MMLPKISGQVVSAAHVAAQVGRLVFSIFVVGPLLCAAVLFGASSLGTGDNPVHHLASGLVAWGEQFRAVPVGDVPAERCPAPERGSDNGLLPQPSGAECTLAALPRDAWVASFIRTLRMIYFVFVLISMGALSIRPPKWLR